MFTQTTRSLARARIHLTVLQPLLPHDTVHVILEHEVEGLLDVTPVAREGLLTPLLGDVHGHHLLALRGRGGGGHSSFSRGNADPRRMQRTARTGLWRAKIRVLHGPAIWQT